MFGINYFRSLGLDRQVLILALGRFVSGMGSGLTMFYAPIFFVNVAGIPAASVGFGLGMGGMSGIVGRIAGGSLADHAGCGRKGALMLACLTLSLGAFCFAASSNFTVFLVGNILSGLGIGLYWPAAESMVSDLTGEDKLNEAFGLSRMADYSGLGIGVVAGGLVIGTHAAYRLLFLFDALSYLALLAFIIFGARETLVLTATHQRPSLVSNWLNALKDRKLALYALLNLVFTNNVLQMSSTLPLYISRLPGMAVTGSVAVVFSYYIILVSLLILPISRKAARAAKTRALMLACLAWLGGQLLTALLPGLCSLDGFVSQQVLALIYSMAAVSIFAFANALYGPAASSLVVELAPATARATYLSVNSLCWGLAGTVGPAVGLTIIDKGARPALLYWLALALLNVISIAGLWALKKLQDRRKK